MQVVRLRRYGDINSLALDRTQLYIVQHQLSKGKGDDEEEGTHGAVPWNTAPRISAVLTGPRFSRKSTAPVLLYDRHRTQLLAPSSTLNCIFLMSQQKASLLLSKQGKLEVGTRPIPTPQGKQALVKVTAAAINPVDWKIVDYGIFIDEFPAVLGTDGAGIIESVGPEVTEFRKGDKIFFQGLYKPADSATFQQYSLVDTEVTSKVPSNINDDQASTIPLGSVTSLVGLFQKSGVPFPESGPTAAGKSVFILGIQLARIAGFSPIVTTASSQHAEYLKSLGATHVFDRDVDLKTLQEAFAGPVSLAFDSISIPSTQKLAIKALTTAPAAPDAHLAVVLPLDPALQKEVEGKVTVNQVFGSSHTWKDLTVPYWQIIGKWIEEGKIVPNHVQIVDGGLSGIPEALDLSKKGVSGVKLVIRPQE
ncbi:hypothetical protein FRC12_021907 [Ceratobasidium sp. 428]|nr:hypothetical protein FRC12_021907 [Ceratobasidium sp. 428]